MSDTVVRNVFEWIWTVSDAVVRNGCDCGVVVTGAVIRNGFDWVTKRKDRVRGCDGGCTRKVNCVGLRDV